MTNEVEPQPTWATKKLLGTPRWFWIVFFIAVAPVAGWLAYYALVASPAHDEQMRIYNDELTNAALRRMNLPPLPPSPPMWPGAVGVVWMIVAVVGGFGWVAIRYRPKMGPLIWWAPPAARRGVGFALGFFALVLCSGWIVPLLGSSGTYIHAYFWGIGLPLLAIVFAAQSARATAKIRAARSPSCWNCDYDIGRLRPDSDRCPECAYPVSDSIKRWKKVAVLMQPRWVAQQPDHAGAGSVSPSAVQSTSNATCEDIPATDAEPRAFPPVVARLGRVNLVCALAAPILSLAVGGAMIWIWPSTMFSWYWWAIVVLALLAPVVGLIRDGWLCRQLRTSATLKCWNCLRLIPAERPGGSLCECGFSVEDSVRRWKACPKALRPKWATMGDAQEKPPPNTA